MFCSLAWSSVMKTESDAENSNEGSEEEVAAMIAFGPMGKFKIGDPSKSFKSCDLSISFNLESFSCVFPSKEPARN